MKRILLSIITGCSLFLGGCGENEAIYYEGEPDGTSGIYFAYYHSYSYSGSSIIPIYQDTTKDFSLTNVAGTSATISIPVRVFGNISDEDRPFVVKAIGGTVEEGKDFSLPEETIMPKGEALINLRVRLQKTDELQDGIVRYITLKLEENEYFKPYIKERMVGNDTVSTQTITIRYSLVFQEPLSWGWYCLPNMGKYSHAKLKFLLDITGWTYSEFNNKQWYYVSSSVALLAQGELQKRADAGDPVREADGSLMQLAGNYLVDYSAYE